MTRRALATAVLVGTVVSCDGSQGRPRAAQEGTVATTSSVSLTSADSQAAHVAEVVASGGVVDSILPIAEHLRRFRASIPVRADSLRNASASLEALAARWAAAVSGRDTAALSAMVVDRAEFAWLYYPESALSKPPYEAPPALIWGQFLANSDAGVRMVLDRFGGSTLAILSLNCAPAIVEGANRLHSRCLVQVRAKRAPGRPARLFGTILERDGRFKFLGLASAL